MPARIALKQKEHAVFASLMGWENTLVEGSALGVDPTTVQRVLNGVTAPGARFIAALLTALAPHGVTFEHLFEVVDDETPEDARADTTLPRSA